MRILADETPMISPLSPDEFEALKNADSLEQRIDQLGQEILANAFFAIDALKKKGKKQAAKEVEVQEELQRQFKIIQGIYTQLKKMNRVTGNNSADKNFSNGLLETIKKRQSSMGAIVTKIGDHVSKKEQQ